MGEQICERCDAKFYADKELQLCYSCAVTEMISDIERVKYLAVEGLRLKYVST